MWNDESTFAYHHHGERLGSGAGRPVTSTMMELLAAIAPDVDDDCRSLTFWQTLHSSFGGARTHVPRSHHCEQSHD